MKKILEVPSKKEVLLFQVCSTKGHCLMILFLYNTTMIVPVFAQQKTAVCIRPKSNIASYEKTRSMIVLEKRENMYRFVILFLIEEMTAAQS